MAQDKHNEVWERMASEPTFDPKTAYITSQVAHITCKKAHHEILAASVSKGISAAYEKLLSSALLIIKVPNEKKERSFYLSRHAENIAIENCYLTYTVSTRCCVWWLLHETLN